MAQRDVAALVLQAGEQLLVVERHERTGGDHDLRAAQAGDRHEQRPVGDDQALARPRPDDRRAQQAPDATRRAPQPE